MGTNNNNNNNNTNEPSSKIYVKCNEPVVMASLDASH